MTDPKGKYVRISTFADADLTHDLETRRSFTGFLMLLNEPPIQLYSNMNNNMETSTYCSELVATIISTELTMEMSYSLRMLGVPIDGPSQILGDNYSIVTNFSITSRTLKKKQNDIAYHQVREA